jgi:hypothetical protein
VVSRARPAPKPTAPENRRLNHEIDEAFADWESTRLVPALAIAGDRSAARANGPDAAWIADDSIPTIVVRPAEVDGTAVLPETP